MRYALPIAVFVALAALIAISPHVEPRRLRFRARQVTEDLRAKHGFRDGSKASWLAARSTDWPPFHYGTRQTLDSELSGMLHGLPVRVAGYELVTNGSRHRYGLAAVTLPRPLEWMEVRGEPTHLSWRAHESELLLWKRDGWDSAAQLITSVRLVLNQLELTGLNEAGEAY